MNFPQGDGENVTLQVSNDLIVHNATNSGGINLEIITPVLEIVNAGANLTLDVGGNLSTDQSGSTLLFIDNNINEVVTGANIFAAVAGNVDAGDLTVEINELKKERFGYWWKYFVHGGGTFMAACTRAQIINEEGDYMAVVQRSGFGIAHVLTAN